MALQFSATARRAEVVCETTSTWMTADLNKPLQEVPKMGSVWARKLLQRFGSIVARCTAPVEVILTSWLKTKGRHIAHEIWESSGRKKNTSFSSLAKAGVRPTRLALRDKYDLQDSMIPVEPLSNRWKR
uniref:Uncharacterized protein n=1 Tax=Trichuris muris TaxID=70415 RepID=A0A5S6Q6S9_TRIMR